jgi:hypothetical protein
MQFFVASKTKVLKDGPDLATQRVDRALRTSCTFTDSKKTEPEVGFSSARSILTSVVLPAPECPTIEINSPGSTEKADVIERTELSGYILETRS